MTAAESLVSRTVEALTRTMLQRHCIDRFPSNPGATFERETG